MSTWAGRGEQGAFVEQCWRDFTAIVHLLGFQHRVEPTVSFYPGNYFAVGRSNIIKRPLAEWKAAYDKAVSPVCHNGPLDLKALSTKVLEHANFTEEQRVMDTGSSKDISGGALEHLANMIYEFHFHEGQTNSV